MIRYALMYKPPKGKWYVHSHKLYDSEHAAIQAAMEFLTPGTPIAVLAVDTELLDDLLAKVPGA